MSGEYSFDLAFSQSKYNIEQGSFNNYPKGCGVESDQTPAPGTVEKECKTDIICEQLVSNVHQRITRERFSRVPMAGASRVPTATPSTTLGWREGRARLADGSAIDCIGRPLQAERPPTAEPGKTAVPSDGRGCWYGMIFRNHFLRSYAISCRR